jgi:4-amino-4-deoxy-L-arabinose transferase-like glycosyltransferase
MTATRRNAAGSRGDPSEDARRLLRPGRSDPADLRHDLLLLAGLALLLLATGLGLRDPWPADEPRFALIARDMVATGQWLFPHVGGDLYQDKPPLFFWSIAAFYSLTGTLRVAFLLPSLLAGIGTVLLTYDLGRRAWSRETGLAAALLLLVSAQLVIQARVAQIDMLLTFFTTAALNGIGRHLLAGPDWRAYAAGGLAAGVGVITKGTGFLPCLLLLPFFALRRLGFSGLWPGAGGARWWLAPAAMLAGIALWLVPMLVAVWVAGDPRLAAYRDEILFEQTVTRYAAPWIHRAPWYYFVVNVIPALWLPGTLLLPWLVPRWRDAWRARDGRAWLFLGWIVLVVLFFSLSAGKRGVYVLPALPAFALAVGPYLAALLARIRVQQALFGLATCVAATAGGAALYLGLVRPALMATLADRFGVTSYAPLVLIAVAAGAALAWLRPARGAYGWAATLCIVTAVQGLWINPMINGSRSSREFAAAVEKAVPADVEFGFVAYREQYLLYLTREITNFGHRRTREGDQEASDAAYWLNASVGRVLVADDVRRAQCFRTAPARPLGQANGREWFLISPPADAACAARGHPEAAIVYRPPGPLDE